MGAYVLDLLLHVWLGKRKDPPIWKNSKPSNLSPMADEAITSCGIQGIVSFLYFGGYCGELILYLDIDHLCTS